jgi:UDP-N-acetyl-D-mannosaminuronic acid transferase (WecB/TagA/CpsF family)
MIDANPTALQWPAKHNVFGVGVSAVTCDEAADAILEAAERRIPAVVSAFAVHALIEACSSRELATKVNRFAIVAPDGQPVRWALNWIHGTRVSNTLQGYELTLALCERAAASGVSIYLYGSSPETLAALASNLKEQFPMSSRLRFAG